VTEIMKCLLYTGAPLFSSTYWNQAWISGTLSSSFVSCFDGTTFLCTL